MTQFTIRANRPNGGQVVLLYDNETSSMVYQATGLPVIPPEPVETPWGTAQVVSRLVPGGKGSAGEDGHKMRRGSTLKISLGLKCNYACSYCSQRFVPEAEDGTPLDVLRFVRELPGWVDVSGLGEDMRIEFWGGEPLVYWKTLKPLAEGIRALLPRASFSIITNGALLTDPIVDWLIATGFTVAISHDGPGQAQRGPDPFEDPIAWPAIQRLYALLHPRGRVSINPMLTRANNSRAEIAAWMQDRFGQDVALGEGTFIDPYDAGGMAAVLRPSEHYAYRRKAFAEIRNGTAANFQVVTAKLMEFMDSLRHGRPASALGQKCGMDRADSISVTMNGKVQTCQNVSTNATAPNGEHHHIGDTGDLGSVALNTATHWSLRPDCRDCPVLQLCKGSCMFLEGPLWQAGCDTAYSDNLPFLAAAIEFMTQAVPVSIEGPLPAARRMLWGPT